MDVLTKRATELNMVNNNAKLLGEMLDHYDKNNCGSEERQLLHELFQVRPTCGITDFPDFTTFFNFSPAKKCSPNCSGWRPIPRRTTSQA